MTRLTFDDVCLFLSVQPLLGDLELLRRALVQVLERDGQRLDWERCRTSSADCE